MKKNTKQTSVENKKSNKSNTHLLELSLTTQGSQNKGGVTRVIFAMTRGDLKKEASKVSGVQILGTGLSSAQLLRLKLSEDDKMLTGKKSEVLFFREFFWLDDQGKMTNHKGKANQDEGATQGTKSEKNENYRHLLVVGLGAKGELSGDPEVVRQALASAYASLRAHQVKWAEIDFDGIPGGVKDYASFLRATVEGLLLASYSFDELKEEPKIAPVSMRVEIVSKSSGSRPMQEAFREGLILSESVNFARRLGDLPGNYLTPTWLAEEARGAAKGTGIQVTIWDKARIKKEKMGGLLGVSLGSSEEPRFIIMEYRPKGSPKHPMVFVGKGLTFDSGGISIKPSASMEEMKYDMCGGANMIGTILAIAKLKIKAHVVALIPATENMPGPSANKPGDVLTARNGKTFEVNNTDAEGRLILADALSYASELKPSMIVDAATLTGAIVIALGNTHTAFFTKDESLKSSIEKAASHTGEWVWQMPLVDFHTKDMKGTFADLSNISASKGAGSSTAAAFLEQFVEKGIPWAHFDIAGTAWATGSRLPYCSKKGASGVMIRTFVELARLRG